MQQKFCFPIQSIDESQSNSRSGRLKQGRDSFAIDNLTELGMLICAQQNLRKREVFLFGISSVIYVESDK